MIHNVNLTYLNEVQNKMINCYVYHYDQGIFVVVNIKYIQLKDPTTNIVTIIESNIHWIKDIV